jgi:segregation and condensation protein A
MMPEADAAREGDTLQGLPVKLEVFEGPLDLLLHLIRENRVDIADIPVAEITEQYLAYLELMKTLNLDVAGEFLVMAATLMHIKSRMLLPAPDEESEEGEDPRLELVRQLQEYQRYKEAGMALKDLEERRSRVFRGSSVGPEGPERTDYPLEVSLLELLSALKKLLERVPEEASLEIRRERLTIAERISTLLEQLRKANRELHFEELFSESSTVGDVIVTFLALLELMRLRMVRARQAGSGERIMIEDIRPAAEEGEEGPSPRDENAPALQEEETPPERKAPEEN